MNDAPTSAFCSRAFPARGLCLGLLAVWAATTSALADAPRVPPFLKTLANSEMSTLAQAEEWAMIDTGYFVSLENLDDHTADWETPAYNYIGDGGGTPVIDPATARFRADRVDLVRPLLKWGGPYVTYQQEGRTDTTNRFGYDLGTPLDPWGGPYYFYTPAGLVRPPLSISLEDYGDYFDRYAIVSYGPDGRFGGGDDLVYLFGAPPARLTLTSVSPLQVEVGGVVGLKGYGLDDDRVEIVLNGAAGRGAVLVRQPALLTYRVHPEDAVGTVTVAVRLPGEEPTTSFEIVVIGRRAQAAYWYLY